MMIIMRLSVQIEYIRIEYIRINIYQVFTTSLRRVAKDAIKIIM
jgi:hypothetical protein